MGKRKYNYTVMIVPHSEDAASGLQLSLGAVQAAVVMLVVLFAVFLAMLYTCHHAGDEIGDISILREQNRIQHDAINALAHDTQLLLEQIEQAEYLAGLLSNEVRPAGILASDRVLFSTIASRSGYAGRSGRVADRAAFNISYLQQVIPEQTETLDALREQVEEHINRLAATPSIWPAAGRFTSGFGVRRDPFNPYVSRFHQGVDIAGYFGTPVVATGDGTIVSSGYQSGWGNLVIINHGYGLSTYYAHLSRFAQQPGTLVSRGQVIGYMGSTGRSTGVHLHYEVHVNGVAVNPLDYMQ